MKRSIMCLGLVALLGAGTAAAAGETRHSGTVVAVQPDRRGFTLEEIGPWNGPGTGLVRREVRLARDTAVRLVKRASDLEATWPVAFEASPLDAMELLPGDFVTVTLDDTGVARTLEVMEPEG